MCTQVAAKNCHLFYTEVMKQRIGVLIFVGCLSIGVFTLSFTAASAPHDPLLTVHFLDVGQGDAILIESPDGTQVLVDGGPDGSVLRELGRTLGYFDRTLDMIVATHPEQDHIGGFVDVLERYDVTHILRTENQSDTPVAALFDERAEQEGAEIYYARAGQVYTLGAGPAGMVTLAILFPDRDPQGLESNTSSIVARLSYGDIEVLLTGDAPQSIETHLVSTHGSGLRSEVLKVGHHGSRTSTAEMFVSAVTPALAIISAGEDNRYGHPHQKVLDTLSKVGATVLNTGTEGGVTLQSDGAQVWIE